MISRNDRCPCGSGKKYKKCCKGKKERTHARIINEELQTITQQFFTQHTLHSQQQTNPLTFSQATTPLFHSATTEHYFLYEEPSLWTGFIKKTLKTNIQSDTLKCLLRWKSPALLIGKVQAVKEQKVHLEDVCNGKRYKMVKEYVSMLEEDMYMLAFIVPTYANQYMPIASVAIFQASYAPLFEQLTNDIPEETRFQVFWEQVAAFEQQGTLSPFESSIISHTQTFLHTHQVEAAPLVMTLRQFFVHHSLSARKAETIAAGAIRFGQEAGLIAGKTFKVKDIAAAFDVSVASVNKYFQEIRAIEQSIA